MPQTNEEWWEAEEYLGAITNEDEARAVVPSIVSEAERRGYKRAMEEVKSGLVQRKAAFSVVMPGDYILPKSFFEK